MNLEINNPEINILFNKDALYWSIKPFWTFYSWKNP